MSDWDEAVTSMADLVARDFRSAFSEAADAKDRTYYDAEADQAPPGPTTERSDPGSSASWSAPPTARRRGTSRRWSSIPGSTCSPTASCAASTPGETFEPEELIEADLAVLQERRGQDDPGREGWSRATPRRWRRRWRRSCRSTVSTWFPRAGSARHEPMRGDLHHLFACESRCNGFRGNTPFADFPDFPPAPPPESEPGARAVRDDCGKSESTGSSRPTERARRPGRPSTSGCATPSTSLPRRCPTTGGRC